MNLYYTSPQEYPSGKLYELLSRSWSPVWNRTLEEEIHRFVADVTTFPESIGSCVFITCLGAKTVGMASYDPRQHPVCGLIGWNCVVPEHRRKGIGTAQIHEILRIFRSEGFYSARVITMDEDFYVPAQRTYESCGFVRKRKTADNRLEYERHLAPVL